MSTLRRRWRFTGTVQGVGFRYYARAAALHLGLTGWVANNWDGSVTLEAQGDRAALEDTIRRYTHYVAAVAARALAPEPLREDLEEVVSDTFLALWRSRESLDPVRSLRPWLAVTARNLAIDRVRRRRETDAIPDHLPDSRPGPEELAERNQLHSQLRRLVDGMEEPDRTLFRRYYFEEEPLHQVAKELGLNQATARTRLARGRHKLREALCGKGGTPCVQSHS